MLVFNSLEEIKDIKPTVVALGNFDGIHLGHQAIIKKQGVCFARLAARQKGDAYASVSRN